MNPHDLSTTSLKPEPSQPRRFRIRTITAGVTLGEIAVNQAFETAVSFLQSARESFEREGFEVQTTRIATEPLAGYLATVEPSLALEAIQELDAAAVAAGLLLGLGPLIQQDRYDPGFASWASDLAGSTRNTSFSVVVAAPETGAHSKAAQTAAETIFAISQIAANGEANFRFAAAANIPAGTPFFPVAHHSGADSFALGLESAALVGEAFADHSELSTAPAKLQQVLEEALAGVDQVARKVANDTSRRFLGLDLSPAPGLDASIAAGIEALTGHPFGAPATVAACAAITRGLDRVQLTRCGYCGLMLPVLEDRVLAQRATEGTYGVRELLLYSSVCGTGLDVVPLPGETPMAVLQGLIVDVAALATRLRKPLAARLLPIPGKQAGETVDFDNPHLTASVVMPVA